MGIRERLDRVRASAKERRSIIWNLNKLSSEIDTIRDAGQRVLTADGVVAHNSTSNPTQDKAIKIVDDYGSDIDKLLIDLEKLDDEIKAVRSLIKKAFKYDIIDINQKNAITYFYIEGMSIEEIELAMKYTERHIQRMKALGVKNLVDNEHVIQCQVES